MNQELLQNTFLQFIDQFLNTAGIPCTYQPSGKDSSCEYLLIAMLQDESDPPLWARFYSLSQALEQHSESAFDAYAILNLDLPIGIQIPESNMQKTAFLLSMINRLLPGPVLLFNPEEGIYFSVRFVVPESDDFWPALLLESLSLLRFLYEPVKSSIHALLSGEKTMEEALALLEKSLATPPAERGSLFNQA